MRSNLQASSPAKIKFMLVPRCRNSLSKQSRKCAACRTLWHKESPKNAGLLNSKLDSRACATQNPAVKSHASYPQNFSPASRHMSVSSSWCSFPALHQRRPGGFRGFPGLKSSVHDYRQCHCIHKKRFAHTGKQRRTKEIHASINTCINPQNDRNG